MENYHTNGYCVVKGYFRIEEMEALQATILTGIQQCIKEFDTDEATYLGAVNRWRTPSPVLPAVSLALQVQLNSAVAPVVGPDATCGKANVVFKNQYANDAIAAHQDLTYNKATPYQMSAWLAVSKVRQDNGAMYVYPKSHLLPIQGAVDFWSPDYQDNLPQAIRQSAKMPVTINLDPGDLLLFDSRLWHGSHPNTSGQHRIGMVTRWTGKNYQPPATIPDPVAHAFGMWTCGEQTKHILQQALSIFYQEEPEDFIAILTSWQQKLQEAKGRQLIIKTQQALEALEHVRVLSLASEQHNGGDAYGRVYKNLWHVLLEPLVQRTQEVSPTP